MHPLMGPWAAALPAYILNELHIHVETDRPSTGPSTPGPQSAYDSEYRDGEAEEQEQEQCSGCSCAAFEILIFLSRSPLPRCPNPCVPCSLSFISF